MIPREHGAYAELLFPIVSVFLGGSPTTATWLLAVGAIACFLANEPLLVLFGQRGTRIKRAESDRAKRALLVFLLLALGTGVAGLLLTTTVVQYAVGVPLLLGVALMMLAIQGLERSMVGEGLAAATLSSIAIPLGLSAGLDLTLTLAVALGVAAFYGSRVGLLVLAAAAPVAVVVLVMAVLQPTARRLRLMGWSLVAANLCSLIAVVTTLKMIQDFDAVDPTLPFPMF